MERNEDDEDEEQQVPPHVRARHQALDEAFAAAGRVQRACAHTYLKAAPVATQQAYTCL